jgi:hypothetical protein
LLEVHVFQFRKEFVVYSRNRGAAKIGKSKSGIQGFLRKLSKNGSKYTKNGLKSYNFRPFSIKLRVLFFYSFDVFPGFCIDAD